MSWIDDTEKRWQAARERDARIEEQATEIYEALWAEVLRALNDVRSSVTRFPTIATNGRPLAHTITLQEETRFPVLRCSVVIELQDSKHRITALGQSSGIDISFDIDICDSDGSACLKFEGREVSYEETSRRILTALLYPGLPYVKFARLL